MTRVTIRYDCGCEVSPYVDIEHEMVHEYDMDGMICKKHTKIALLKAKRGEKAENSSPFGPLLRMLDGTHP